MNTIFKMCCSRSRWLKNAVFVIVKSIEKGSYTSLSIFRSSVTKILKQRNFILEEEPDKCRKDFKIYLICLIKLQVIEFWQNRTNGLVYLPPLLKQSISSNFDSSTSLSDIIEQMMIEQWSSNISYSSFFTQCNPQYCTYIAIERSDIIGIVTTLIGIFSGLNVALRLLTPLVIRAIFWFKDHVHGTSINC
jgi:hypothetical protein